MTKGKIKHVKEIMCQKKESIIKLIIFNPRSVCYIFVCKFKSILFVKIYDYKMNLNDKKITFSKFRISY